MRHCDNCGSEIASDNDSCKYCGKKAHLPGQEQSLPVGQPQAGALGPAHAVSSTSPAPRERVSTFIFAFVLAAIIVASGLAGVVIVRTNASQIVLKTPTSSRVLRSTSSTSSSGASSSASQAPTGSFTTPSVTTPTDTPPVTTTPTDTPPVTTTPTDTPPVTVVPTDTPPPMPFLGSTSVVSGTNSEYVYGVGSDGALWEIVWSNVSWSKPARISQVGAFPPNAKVAVVNGVNKDIYSVGSTGSIEEMYNNGSWQGPTAISPSGLAPAGAGITVVRGTTEDVYVVGVGGSIQEMSFSTHWQGPFTLPITQSFTPGAELVATVSGTESLSLVGPDGAIWIVAPDGEGWSAFPLTNAEVAQPGTGITAVPYDQGDGLYGDFIYIVGYSGAIERVQWPGDLTRDGASSLQTIITSPNFAPGASIAAVQGINLDIYVVAEDGTIWETYYYNASWQKPVSIF